MHHKNSNLKLKGSFGAQDRKTGCDITILSWFNLLFDTPTENDIFNLFLILSYFPFVIFILSFWWVKIMLSWLALKSLFCPLSIHRSCSLCSPSIDLYLFLHNSSTLSLLFVTDLTPILPYNHVFLNLLKFLSISYYLLHPFQNECRFSKKKKVSKWMSLSVSNAIITFYFQLYPSINTIYTTSKVLFFFNEKQTNSWLEQFDKITSLFYLINEFLNMCVKPLNDIHLKTKKVFYIQVNLKRDETEYLWTSYYLQ